MRKPNQPLLPTSELRSAAADLKRSAMQMAFEQESAARGWKETAGIACGWLSAAFAGLFVFALVIFAAGIIDLREGGEAAFAVIFVTVPPVLLLSLISIVLRGPRRAIVAWLSLAPFSFCILCGLIGAIFRR